jgi:hypothetical protein
MVLQSSMKLIIWADFKLNQDDIAKNLCENKNRPKLKCKGNCQLMKALKKQEAAEKSTNQQLKDKSEILFFKKMETFAPCNLAFLDFNNCTQYISLPYKTVNFSIFHPPMT